MGFNPIKKLSSLVIGKPEVPVQASKLECDGKDFITTLPDDVIIYIVIFLDRRSVGRVLQICKKITKLASSEFLWKQLTLNATPREDRYEVEAQILNEKTSWKDAYKDISIKL